jgi:hypothetical protein
LKYIIIIYICEICH